jgi:hypothetical protein
MVVWSCDNAEAVYTKIGPSVEATKEKSFLRWLWCQLNEDEPSEELTIIVLQMMLNVSTVSLIFIKISSKIISLL